MQLDQSTTTTTTALDAASVQAFAGSLRGELIQPGDPSYDGARRIFNGMIDRHPRLIARCLDAADVISAVNFAREQGLTLSVRGGAHNVAGSSMNDGGLVIDLSHMRGVRVDPANRTVRAAGGATWGDVDHATHAFGLAAPGGLVSTTGVGGLTLGGGLGYLTRKYGLSIDNLLSVDLVTASGEFVTASADENTELFWGVRGGGGNFGVVTSFEFQAHPVSIVYGGPLIYPVEMANDVLKLYRDFLASAPDEMNAFFAFLIVPPGPPFPEHLWNKTMCGLVCCYIGPMEQTETVVRPLREFGPPALDMLGPIPFPVLNSLFDELAPSGLQQYWKADLTTDLTDEMIEVHAAFGPKLPTIPSIAHIYAVSGAANRVAPDATAYAHRRARFTHFIGAAYTDPAETPQHVAWVRDYWSALHPYAEGAYANFLMDEGEERVRSIYGANYERLVDLKRRYDPTNLFHMNQNIKP